MWTDEMQMAGKGFLLSFFFQFDLIYFDLFLVISPRDSFPVHLVTKDVNNEPNNTYLPLFT